MSLEKKALLALKNPSLLDVIHRKLKRVYSSVDSVLSQDDMLALIRDNTYSLYVIDANYDICFQQEAYQLVSGCLKKNDFKFLVISDNLRTKREEKSGLVIVEKKTFVLNIYDYI